jgi:hypothetical protein
LRIFFKIMTHDQFWKIIGDACGSDAYSSDEWETKLTEALTNLSANEIIEWNHIFDDLAQQAYRTDLWAAAYLINGGASDDGFYYFRCWLIGMGQSIYNNAIADPVSLVDVASPAWFAKGIDAEAEIYAAPHRAWMRVTGNDYNTDYPVRNASADLVGEDWNFDDHLEMQKRLPRLSATYDGS